MTPDRTIIAEPMSPSVTEVAVTGTLDETRRAPIVVFDLGRAERAVRELLLACGEDPAREGLRETPTRVARAYQEMFAGLYTNPENVLSKTFDESHDELVLVTEVPMFSQWPLPVRARFGQPPPARGREGFLVHPVSKARVGDGGLAEQAERVLGADLD